MKKDIALSALLLMASSGTAFAGIDSRVSVLEAQMNEISTRTAHGNIGAKTASASPQILGENWYFTGDMLWWHADEGGTDYAQVAKNGILSAPSSPVKNHKLTFDWDFGFKAGIGKIFAHDKWDLFLNFTWFRTKNSAKTSLEDIPLGSQGAITPLLVAGGPIGASHVKAHWKIRYYVLDLDLGRDFFISPKLSVHPYVGLKTAWIDQRARSVSDVFFPSAMTLKSKDRNNFWGIGPSLGFDGKWFLDYGFYFLSSIGGAILWGDFDVHHRESRSAFSHIRNNYHLDIHQISPMAQVQLGIGYETNLYHNSYHIAVNVSYENQYWWNQNQIPKFTAFTIERYHRYAEDLSLQGITVDVRFDF